MVFLPAAFPGDRDHAEAERLAQAVELELAHLGYVLSHRASRRLQSISADELSGFRTWVIAALSEALGASYKHVPLFRTFPDGVPDDTRALWVQKVLAHFLQDAKQPCLFCGRFGTTHVLSPCQHVVCDHCWDGAKYSACPICEHHVDRSSPFFKPSAPRELSPKEKVTFKLLDLAEDMRAESKALFVQLCERKQALSPDDRAALTTLLVYFHTQAMSWLPETIPLRENIALIFGTLAPLYDSTVLLPVARKHMTTATDVLRFLTVRAGGDASLQKKVDHKHVQLDDAQGHPLPIKTWWQKRAIQLGMKPVPGAPGRTFVVPVATVRGARCSLPRALRRGLLAMLEEIPQPTLIEDMLRHRSAWVWVGEVLHPSEYAKRYPNVATAFAVLRRKAPDGTKAPVFRNFYSKVEAAVRQKDAAVLVGVLARRPGELARRVDLALRLASTEESRTAVYKSISSNVAAFSTPVLLTLRSVLTTRHVPAKRRLFWPKGQVAKGVSTQDTRPLLPAEVTSLPVRTLDQELLDRFAKKPPFETAFLDESLRSIMVPFNERTASRSAVSLPRGSHLPLPQSKALRLFLHWCEPEDNGRPTDLDLSIGFYDANWRHTGLCSYSQLKLADSGGGTIARSAGDMRDAPFPDGATELVDLDRERALAAGFRYAVMVVNAYSGMAFNQLERAFAGVMLRDDLGGAYFDPRTVELKFALTGDNGVFLPLVIDLQEGRLHWLDVYSEGRLQFNNVQSSNGAITRICPEMIDYFASGVRPSMLDLGLYHAAARCQRVFLRPSEAGPADSVRLFVRRPEETISAFYERLTARQADEPRARPPFSKDQSTPMLALLHKGDVEPPEHSLVYALFRERIVPTVAASDLLS